MTGWQYYGICLLVSILGQIYLPQVLSPVLGKAGAWIFTYIILVIFIMLFAAWFAANEKKDKA